MSQPTGQPELTIREQARHMVYERLALLSAAIWTVGTAILMFTIVPYVEHPQAYIAVAMVIPILPAAIPWLFYRPLSGAVARRRMRGSGTR